MANSSVHTEYVEKLKSIFTGMVVYKDAARNKFISSMGIPSFLRDWLVMRFSDETGRIDTASLQTYIEQFIPRREQWERLKTSMVKEGARIKFLAKIRVEMDVKTGEGLFTLPDFGFPSRKYEAIILDKVLLEKKQVLFEDVESWGVLQLEWRLGAIPGFKNHGAIVLTDFQPFKPYKVDLSFFQEARAHFSLDEWLDTLLMAVDYSPQGFLNNKQKLTLISRLLPFVEPRLNIIELAPKGTGKSYLFSQISKYGWLISGGNVTRARLFYDVAKRLPGLITRHDYLALDEIQSITFPDEDEIRGALKGYLESGEFRVGDYKGIGEAGFVLLGNIKQRMMSEEKNMFQELPRIFHESALLDRFHGFILGWKLPRMKENMKAQGWGLNAEYFSEIMHELRKDIRYRAIVDELLDIPKGADTRDTEAIKRLSTGYIKLLFPHATSPNALTNQDFQQYCFNPAFHMRQIIRKQLNILDAEYSINMPDINVRGNRG
jgi:ATP-dependent Lon protease